jgi:hypothetical protein
VTRAAAISAVLLAASALVWVGQGTAAAATCVSWAGFQPANPSSSGDNLAAVSAPAPCDVWVVGYQAHGIGTATLAEHWDGNAWKVTPSSNPGGAGRDSFTAVAALSPADAWAVGFYGNGSADRTLIELLSNGTWEQVSSPDPGGAAHDNLLNAVAITSAGNAWAVGDYSTGTSLRTLIERWNGTTWSQVPSPNVGTSDNGLLGVTATSGKDAWAVGYYTDSHDVSQTLVEHWNGSKWKRVLSPDPGGSANSASVSAVAATSPSSAWAVGNYFKAGITQPLVMRWNGKAWKPARAPSLDRPSVDASLNGVTVVSATNAWAVGSVKSDQTLAAHWNGKAWTRVPSPDPGPFADFVGVAATRSGDVWAAGVYNTGSSPNVTFAVQCC